MRAKPPFAESLPALFTDLSQGQSDTDCIVAKAPKKIVAMVVMDTAALFTFMMDSFDF
jgi:hypothetical protein